ncbi:PREDICTED: elongator complex protein 4, partial [Habropoda laboriosa]
TSPSSRNSLTLISSGISTLDHIIGGGLPVGSLFLIEEDRYGTYAKVMIKHFMAESVVTNQPLLIASKDTKPTQFVSEIPAVAEDTKKFDPLSYKKYKKDEEMQIAWRYQHMHLMHTLIKGNYFGHYYDLTKPMKKEVIEKADITQWYDDSCPEKDSGFNNKAYTKLLVHIQETLKKGQYSISENPPKRQILRVVIHSLGSKSWFSDSEDDTHKDLLKFLFLFRALLRYHYAVGMVTVPTEVLDNSNSIVERIEHMSDIAIRLESFAGSQKERNMLFREYHGLLHSRKMLALNTIGPRDPELVDFVFKLRRSKFIIEVLHIPPELEDTTEMELPLGISVPGCSNQGYKKLLDF